MSTAQELVADVRDLVTLPDVYLRIQSLLRDPDSNIDDFARIIHTDPGLTARVLRLANSAFFGVSRKVETVTLAINLMGVSRLHDIVLATSVINTFNALPVQEISMPLFWQRSIHAGILARMLARRCAIFDSERLFVAGLLHDIGHLVMYVHMPEQALAADREATGSSQRVAQAEQQLLGFHYGDVGAELMNLWLFPDSLQTICRWHDTPAAAPSFALECSLVHIAQRIAHGAQDSDPAHAVDAFALQTSGIPAAALAQLHEESLPHLAETVDMLVSKRAA
jgi:HD-like signal output (HDOD) protein